MKKGVAFIFKTFVLFISIILLASCSESQSTNKDKTYDKEFITALGEGLDSRWKITTDWSPSGKNYKKISEIELEKVEEFRDKKFENNKLQELAISYVNELQTAIEIADTYGSNSFDENWRSHENRRTELLSKIQSIKKIPVKNENILAELVARGKEVESNSEKEKIIKDFVSTISFKVDEEKSNEYSTVYSAIVENMTKYDIDSLSLSINLIDAEGVTFRTSYTSATNWKKGTKTRFEFTDFEKKTQKMEVNISSYKATE